MTVIKCKMCGGNLNLVEDASTAECEYCGSVQTVPKVDDEKKLTLFARANRLRAACEFDKAAGIYEAIVADFPEEAEAYWGLILCKYGIEYVDDPGTGKKIPTCHRSSFDSIMEDSDLEQAMENADLLARRVYREEAKQIEEIRKGIIAVSAKEEPYDIFICYKETAQNGDRTIDSVLAQDVYDALTDKGYRVFFSRITLEDKLGMEYEPYIFAALNSARIMLVFGTDYEYFNAVWVKNEWSRFLKLMAKDKQRHLIPCFKGIDAYDMPKEFARLQAQDLGKVGATQDLLRGIEKILPKQQTGASQPEHPPVTTSNTPTAPLLQRAFLFLEDEEWESAHEYCEKVLDLEPQNPLAYVAKLMVELKVSQQENLVQQNVPLDQNGNYKKALRFAGEELRAQLEGYNAAIIARLAAQDNEEKEKYASAFKNRRNNFQHWISAGEYHTACLFVDGTAAAFGQNLDQRCNVDSWRDLVAVSVGETYTVGLRSDGTAVGIGSTQFSGRRVDDWKDIIEISAGKRHTVGLRRDGTVVATRFTGASYEYYGQCDVSDWKDIISVSAGSEHTVGLRKDGTVIATKHKGSKMLYSGQCEVEKWNNIIAISAGESHTVGLRRDGTVVAVGNNGSHKCNAEHWQDIVAISAGKYHTVGLRRDGTVVAIGDNSEKQCDVSYWRDIVAISAGSWHTVGLRRDGTLVSTMSSGLMNFGQCNAGGWKLFENPDRLDAERFAGQKKLKEAGGKTIKPHLQWRKEGKCQHCGSRIKSGLFSSKCITCGSLKDY